MQAFLRANSLIMLRLYFTVMSGRYTKSCTILFMSILVNVTPVTQVVFKRLKFM